MKSIDISAFETEVQSLTASETPYVYQVTGLTSDMFDQRPYEQMVSTPTNPLREALVAAPPGVLLDLSPTELPPLANGVGLFHTCESLVASPRLPDGIKDLTAIYMGCTALTEPPHLPEGVTSLAMAFCGGDEKDLRPMSLSRPPVIPASVGATDLGAFDGAPRSNYIPPLERTFFGCISMSDAPVIPEGIKSLRYTFGYSGVSSPPQIPDTVTDMTYAFMMCRNLTAAPRIPLSVKVLYGTFAYCSLLEAPELPMGLEDMTATFAGNQALVRVPNVPYTVTNLTAAFTACQSLEVIEEFSVDVTRCTMTNAFADCPNLKAVYTPNNDIKRIGRWRMWQLTFDDEASPIQVEARVFSEHGDIEHHTFFEYTDSDFEPGKYGLMFYPSGALGEIMQASSRSEIVRMVSEVLRYRLPVGNLAPVDKRVLHADADTLSGSAFVPPGALILYGGVSAPKGWLLCNGSAVGRDEYRNLFNAIGTMYGAGNGVTTFNLPDMRLDMQMLFSERVWYSEPIESFLLPKMRDTDGQIHPHQRAVSLYEALLSKVAKPGDRILDTHVGSGSIRIACHKMGFDFVGCEIHPGYYETQEQRYRMYIKQGY